MKFVDTGDPDILQTRRGGGVALVFGLPFLAVGLFIGSLAFGWFPSEGTAPPGYVSATFGLVFASIGIAMSFGRSGMTLDRRRGTVMYWYGLLVPMKKTVHPLFYYERISLRQELRRGENRSYHVYPVVLDGSHGGREGIVLAEPSDYPEARRTAEKIATFLGFPLADTSSGEEIVRDPDTLSESVRERARRTAERAPTPDPPPRMTASIREESGSLVIEIPPRKLGKEHFKRMAILLVLGIAVGFAFVGVKDPRRLELYDLILYSAMVLGILLFATRAVLRPTRRNWQITVSADMLRVEARTPRGRQVTEIPIDELEDFVLGDADLPGGVTKTHDGRYRAVGEPVRSGKHGGHSHRQIRAGTKLLGKFSLIVNPPGPSITASSDRARVTFGKGLRREELHYLYAVMKTKIIR